MDNKSLPFFSHIKSRSRRQGLMKASALGCIMSAPRQAVKTNTIPTRETCNGQHHYSTARHSGSGRHSWCPRRLQFRLLALLAQMSYGHSARRCHSRRGNQRPRVFDSLPTIRWAVRRCFRSHVGTNAREHQIEKLVLECREPSRQNRQHGILEFAQPTTQLCLPAHG